MLPIIDYKDMISGQKNAVEQLKAGAYETGFLILKNTPITDQQLYDTFDAYRRFFTQPLEEKSAVDMARTHANRGWGAPHSEQVNPGAKPDFKQVFDCGFELDRDDPLRHENLAVYSDNLWPSHPKDFKAIAERYAQSAFALAIQVLEAITNAIGGNSDYFTAHFSRPMALLRGNYYPPKKPNDLMQNEFGIAPHTDYGCITLLATDATPGLEVQSRSGEWFAVSPPVGHFIINFGEMIEMWTNGAVRATLHRVKGSEKERISIPLFFNPNHDTNVAPLGSGQTILAADHLQKRFSETYLHLKDKPADTHRT